MSHHRANASRRGRAFSPTGSALEGRELLAAVVYNPTNGTLVVNMNEVANQRLTMGQVNGLVTINGQTGGIVNSTTNRLLSSVSASRVSYIQVQGTRFVDSIDLSGIQGHAFSALSATLSCVDLFGYGGNDKITGSAFSDRITGDGGDDTLRGGAGNDSLYGGADRNTLDGGAGDDTLWGDLNASNVYDGGRASTSSAATTRARIAPPSTSRGSPRFERRARPRPLGAAGASTSTTPGRRCGAGLPSPSRSGLPTSFVRCRGSSHRLRTFKAPPRGATS